MAAVVARVWADRTRPVVVSAAGRVHAIGDPDPSEPGVWLGTTVEAIDAATTRVTLVLDELERGPNPTDGLDELLDLVEHHLTTTGLQSP